MAVVLRALTWQSAKPAEQSFPGDSSVFPVVSQSQGSRSGGESSPCIAALPASGPHLPAQLVPDLSLSNPATPASPSPNMAPQDWPCFQILLPEGPSQFTPRHTGEAQITRPSAPPWGSLLHPSQAEAAGLPWGPQALDRPLCHSLLPPESGRGQPDSGHSQVWAAGQRKGGKGRAGPWDPTLSRRKGVMML